MAFTKVVGAGIHTLSNITSHNIHSSGILTATGLDISGDATIGGVLTYEDVTSIDSVGLITARNGIDCNADLDVDGHTNLDNVSIAGVTTFNNNAHFKLNDKLYFGNNNELEIYQQGNNTFIFNNDDRFEIGQSGQGAAHPMVIYGGTEFELKHRHTNGGQNSVFKSIRGGAFTLYHAGSNTPTADQIRLETTSAGLNFPRDIDVDGHTNLDNVSIAGITTFASNVFLGDNDRIIFGDGGLSDAHVRYDGSHLQFGVASGSFRVSANTSSFVNYAGTQTLATINSTGVSIPLNLDVDGHTNLDNVSIAGVSTFAGNADFSAGIDVTGSVTSNDLIVTGTGVVADLKSTNNNYVLGLAGNNNSDEVYVGTDNSGNFLLATGSGVDERLRITSDGQVSITKDLDVDGHTNLDNVSIAGVTTFANNINLTSNSLYPLDLNSSQSGKIVLQGSNDPYITFREGSTDKAYIQWNSGGYFDFWNHESSERLRVASGTNGLQYVIDGTGYAVWHSANDGSGSGLSADNLDGREATQFIWDYGTSATSNINTLGGQSGKHRWNASTTGRPASGQSNEYGTVLHLDYDGNRSSQLAWDIAENNLYARTLEYSSDSGTWVRFLTESDEGSGNGLDADSVDGIQASSFLRSDAEDTTNSQISFTTSSQYPININGGNNGKIVLQGSASPYIRFRESSTDKAYIQWDSGAGEFIMVNQESGDYLRIGSGLSGLKYTADGSNATIWHSANHGHGSGLNADTLDGIEGANLLRSDTSDTMSGTLSVDRIDITGTHGMDNTGWYRTDSSGTGMYNTSTGQHFYSDHDDYWNIAGGGTANGLRFRDDHNGTVRGYVYANNSNQVGFLNESGAWTLRTQSNGISKLGSNGYQLINGNNSRNLYFYSGDTGSTTDIGISGFTGGGQWRFQLYGANGAYGFLDANWSGWDIKKVPNGIFQVDEGSGLARVWNSLNDGPSSGLNADMLDDLHESSFVRNNSNQSRHVLRFGSGNNTSHVRSNNAYAIFQEGGAWSSPYPDLVINYHTGIKIGCGQYSYGGLRFTPDYNSETVIMGINDGVTGGGGGQNNVFVRNKLLIGGLYNNNSYNSVSSTRLLFGGGNDQDNYHIGTNLENYGGNFSKLDLRWHTGIRMGAQATYGGIRFFNNEDLSTLLFSIGRGDANTRVESGSLIISSGNLEISSGDFAMQGELNMTLGGNKTRYIDCCMDSGEALVIRSTLNGDANHTDMARFHRGGSVDLYHNNSPKFFTAGHGATLHGDLHMSGGATGTNQNRSIYWTGFDKEATSDFTDYAQIRHTTNQNGITGSVLQLLSYNDANDGIALDAAGGAGQIAFNGQIRGNIDMTSYGSKIIPSFGTGSKGIRWNDNAAGGGGDACHIQYFVDGSGEDTRLRIHIANDGNDDMRLEGAGGVHVQGTFTASNNKGFRIPHVLTGLTTTTDLVHSAIEGPQTDNLYRGRTTLVAGISTVNIDTTNNMTDGTFVNLNRDVQCFTTNETGWTAIKGSVDGNLLTIVAQDNTCTDTISWMVIGERWDLAMYDPRNPLTDANGKLKTEIPNKSYNKGGGFEEDYIEENKHRVGISTFSRPSIENKEVE